jgi:3-hydroxymyristoyl/3-hydroxydecanoyl-(acyl carrier protein) dehydratase
MSVTPLVELLAGGRREETPVAASGGGVAISLSGLRRDVRANGERIRRTGCRRALLLTGDAYWGAVGLFALMSADVEVLMPPNIRPDIATTLAGLFDLIVTDKPLHEGASLVLAAGESGDAETPVALKLSSRLTFLTSGTTGVPKQVAKTLAHLSAETEAIEALLGPIAPREAKVLATVPHQHAYGLAFRMLWPLATGRLFVSTTLELWETVLSALEPGAVLVTSPAHLSRMGGLAPVSHERRPSLVLSAGAPLAETDARLARTVFGLPVREIFGSTETGAIASRLRDRADPAWHPLPCVAIGAGHDGIATVRARHVPDPGSIGSDRVLIDADGIRFIGRADAIVKIEGVRVDPTEIAEQLRGIPWVADAAVAALGDPPTELGAAMTLTEEGRTLLARIGPFRLGRLARRMLAQSRDPAALPRRWRFVEALPARPLGKTGSADIAALFHGGGGNDPVREPETCAVRRTENGVDIDLFLTPAIVYFQGHFPGFPIAPAVAQIDWAVRLAGRHLGLSVASAPEFRVKFRKMMLPGTHVTLSLRLTGTGNSFRFEYRTGLEVLSSGTIARAVSAQHHDRKLAGPAGLG